MIHDDLANWRVRACRVHAGCAAIRVDTRVVSLSRNTELLRLSNLPPRRAEDNATEIAHESRAR
jgi:hypothetical protein